MHRPPQCVVHPPQCTHAISQSAPLRMFTQSKNIGWESGQQKRASAKVPELKESLQLKWHDMAGRWPTNDDVPEFESYSKVTIPFHALQSLQQVSS